MLDDSVFDSWHRLGFFNKIQTGSGVYLALCSVGSVDGGWGMRWLGREVNRHLHPVLKSRMSGAVPLLIYLHGKDRETMTVSPLRFTSCSYPCTLFLERPEPLFFP